MLTDSSLTNILAVSGVSQIRYRVYQQLFKKENLVNYLKKTNDNNNNNNILMRAYTNLVSTNIPAVWRFSQQQQEQDDLLSLELWVFWFDEKHTGRIDANEDLNALEEIKIGLFTWENAYSKIQSPTASPVASSTHSNSNSPVKVAEEYKLFIKSVRNLVHLQMKKKGAFPLGEFFIFPTRSNDILGDNTCAENGTVLCCSYNIYLANTNLIFQPNIRRMRIKPITSQIIHTRGKKVILSPSGETAYISPNKYSLSPQLAENILKRWSLLFDIPYEHLIKHQHKHDNELPTLVAIKTSSEEHVFYPTALVFISSSSKLSPTAIAGMNGLFGYNQGFSEDLGDKWSRWAWSDKVNNNGNYWNYTCPQDKTIISVLDKLSVSPSQQQQQQQLDNFLQKALNEPVIASPLMAAKTVATPGSIRNNDVNCSTPGSMLDEAKYRSTSLADFAISQFGIPDASGDQEMEYMPSIPHSDTNSAVNLVEPNSTDTNTPIAVDNRFNGDNQLLLLQQQQQQQQLLLQQPEEGQNQQQLQQPQQQPSQNQSPQLNAMDLDAFGIDSLGGNNGMDSMMLDMSNSRWIDDGMNDLDNFDFGVTEEDFDFFESGPTNTAATAPPSAIQQQPVDTFISNAPSMLISATDVANLNEPKLEQVDYDNLLEQPDELLDDSMMMDINELSSAFDQKPQNYILDTPTNTSVTPLEVSMPNNTKEEEIEEEEEEVVAVEEGKEKEREEKDNHGFHTTSLHLFSKDNTEDASFVPPEFAPVKTEFTINDSKYCDGGKFMYAPLLQQDHGKKSKRSVYLPDYVPTVRKKKSKKKALDGQKTTQKEHQKQPQQGEDGKEIYQDDNNNNTIAMKKESSITAISRKPSSTGFYDDPEIISSSSSSSSSDGESSSRDNNSYSNSDSEMEEVEKDPTKEEEEAESIKGGDESDENTRATKTIHSLGRIQDSYIQKFLFTSSKTKKRLDINTMAFDYDSPFARTIATSIVRAETFNVENVNHNFRALDYLCQQAVLGGYPFSGGIESMSSNGFEANEGESAKVLVARRRDLLQQFNGDTIHTPSTPDDVDQMTQDFKNTLLDIFTQNKFDTDSMYIDQPPLPSSVTIKGPLNVHQYYDLSETNQAHSKYGKYQVKKRRPAEPNLDTLQPPNIVVGRQDEYLEGTSKLIMFWEKLRLEPYSNKKNIKYFVLYPKNEPIERHVTQFFKGLSTLYETCQLGVHHPGNVGPYRKGLVPVPLLSPLPNESFEDRQIRSYFAECQNLGAALGGAVAENVHIVIYLVNPASHLSSNLGLSRCFSNLMSYYHKNNTNKKSTSTKPDSETINHINARVVMQLVPIEHVLRLTSFGGCLKFGLKEIAFAVYSKCHHVVLGRLHNNNRNSVMEMYAPPFILTKPIPDSVEFKLNHALGNFPTILESHAVLHLGYTFSLDKRWAIVVWTDNRGELVEFAILDKNQQQTLSMIFEEIWHRTKQVAQRTGFPWTFVIAKMGLMFEEELETWIQTIPNDEKVAIVSLDLESSLYVSSASDLIDGGDLTGNTTPETMNTPTASGSGSGGGGGGGSSVPMMSSGGNGTNTSKKIPQPLNTLPGGLETDDLSSSETKALLLNHRVAYSNKRERAYYGVLEIDSVSDGESWMIPLASGYLIHSSPPTENPNNELFSCSPLVVEIHLVYNQTNHSAYSTLRDIIRRYHALSYVNVMPSNSNCFPIHLSLVERLSRILLVVNT